MKDHPILFSGPMVRAICEGRKTMTRRVVQFNKPYTWHEAWQYVYPHPGGGFIFTDAACPDTVISRMAAGREGKIPQQGKPGDRLWVRETWAQDLDGEIFYAADHLQKPSTIDKWRPSIFMPRAVSRIALEINSVRAERLQAISESDAMAEGCPTEDYQNFRMLWDSINAKRGYGWSQNPWVWVIQFRRL